MLSNTGVPEDQWVFQRSADLRYARQAYELNVPLEGERVDHGSLKKLVDGYHERHAQTYGHKNEAESVQIVTLRVTATGQLPEPSHPAENDRRTRPFKANRMAWF